MCASSGITSNSNETGLSCDNAESITDGMVACPIVLNLPLTDVKVLWCVAGRRSQVESKSLGCLQGNESFPGTTAINQGSRDNKVTVGIFSKRHSNWVLVTLLESFAGIRINGEYFL